MGQRTLGLRTSLYPHVVTIRQAEGWAMYHLHTEALDWLLIRAKASEFDYSTYTFRTDFAFRDEALAFEFKMRWG